jgi:hypothetical protein
MVPLRAEATEWFVAPGANGTGTAAAPFGKIQLGLNAAQPGDTVTIGAGTYNELLTTVRPGTSTARIVVRAAGPRGSVVVTVAGRVFNVSHAYLTVEGVVFDGQYGLADTVKVSGAASYLTLRNVEVRRSTYDLVDMAAPRGVVIEDSLIHHALNAAGGRTDAHGIVAGAVQDLVVRNTEIHTFSGDAFQLDPGRNLPGWNHVTVEGCRFWLAPLPAAENGFAAGTVPGENAIDTKTNAAAPRAALTIRDTVAYGFRSGLIGNMAAFNLKENVDAMVDGVTVYDSEIGFRTRGPGSNGGAWVTVKNGVVYGVAKAFRYEDDIAVLRIWNTTLGRAVTRPFEAASSGRTGLDVRNLLILGTTRPVEASDPSNLLVGSTAFVNASADNYGLVPGSLPVDAGLTLVEVTTDRLGVSRPQGRYYDVGAYELPVAAPAAEVVIHTWHAPIMTGSWRVVADSTAADGLKLYHPNTADDASVPLANPASYFEVLAWVEAGVPYRLWLRERADSNSVATDSVWVQFSSSVDVSGTATARIGTTSAMLVELADCTTTCLPKGWGWQDNGTGSAIGTLGPQIWFSTAGWETIRVQPREDGVAIDQLVLSPSKYLNVPPGPARNDKVILPES